MAPLCLPYVSMRQQEVARDTLDEQVPTSTHKPVSHVVLDFHNGLRYISFLSLIYSRGSGVPERLINSPKAAQAVIS